MDLRGCRAKYRALAPTLTERSRRVWAATEARALGRGGITLVARATGISTSTIARGLNELRSRARTAAGPRAATGWGPEADHRQGPDAAARSGGAGRADHLGDPDSPLRWTAKSTRTLARTLQRMGHRVSHQLVRELLSAAGYSLQANRKTREGAAHPDRDAQFRHINAQVRQFQAGGPAGDLGGHEEEGIGRGFQECRADVAPDGPARDGAGARLPHPGPGQGHPLRRLRPHAQRRAGSASASTTTRPALPCARSAGGGRRWGARAIRRARALLITADGGGSNGARLRLWKWELQQLANARGLTITVCHFPPGTSKWNKIEHRLFSYISRNWRGQPLVSLGRDRQPDWRHADGHGPARAVRVGSRHVSEGSHDLRRATRRAPAHAPSVSRRLELHHPPGPLMRSRPLIVLRALRSRQIFGA